MYYTRRLCIYTIVYISATYIYIYYAYIPRYWYRGTGQTNTIKYKGYENAAECGKKITKKIAHNFFDNLIIKLADKKKAFFALARFL